MTDKGLNIFDNFTAEFVYQCPQKEECNSSSWGHSKKYTPGTIENSETDRAPTKINRNDAFAKVRVLVELGIL